MISVIHLGASIALILLSGYCAYSCKRAVDGSHYGDAAMLALLAIMSAVLAT